MFILLWACSRETAPRADVPEGKVQIEFQLPGSFVNVSSAGTRAVDNLGPNWRDLPDMTASLLPVGSTLWLTYARAEEGSTAENQIFGTPELKGYVVGTSTSGYNTLYPCTVTETDGKLTINTDEIGAPLYLETGTYKFKMISPAYPISSDLKMWVDNGMYFYSTDGRYEETYSEPIDIEITDKGVQYITLKPIISQVARFTFTIHKGEGVNTLEPLAAGIEISGLQDPHGHESENTEDILQYDWCSEDISDTLVMKIGDKRSWVTLPGENIQTGEDGTLTGDIGVLPTLAMSTPISILVNIAVNGVPTQYMTLVNEDKLIHSHSYNMEWTISMEEGRITVVTWQNQSWVTDIIGTGTGTGTTSE